MSVNVETDFGQEPGPEFICLGWLVVCGFLISCREGFTTQVQVILRVHLLYF